jgi:tryptophan-rich sensory protein
VIVLAVVAVQVIGGAVSVAAIRDGWYATPTKPAWTPPNWVFGPVWTVLYGMMAAAGWVVWANRRTHDVRRPLLAFVIQLGLNLL